MLRIHTSPVTADGRVFMPNGKSNTSLNRKVYYQGMFYSVWVSDYRPHRRTTHVYRGVDPMRCTHAVVVWVSRRNGNRP